MLNTEKNPGPRLCILLLILITAVGSALRLYKLNYQSLWYDEIHTVFRADPATSIPSIIEYAQTSRNVDQPPAFFILMRFTFKIFGYTEGVERLPSALMGILSVVVMYYLAREFADSKSGLLAAALTALNYFHIYHSQEARFYTMLFLLSALSYLFLIRAFKHLGVTAFAMYTLSTIVLLYTHYFGMVIFATQVLTFFILIAFYRRDKRFVVSGLISGIVIAISFLPWVLVVMEDLQESSFWAQRPTPFFILDYFYNYFGKDILQTLVYVVLIVYFFRNYFTGKEMVGPQKKQLFMILVMWLVLSYLIPFVRSVISTPILHIRYTMIALPAWIIIFSAGWESIKNQKLKFALAGLIILSSVVNLFFFRDYYTRIQKQQIREVALFVQSKNNTGVPVFSPIAEYYNYYFAGNNTVASTTDATFSNLNKFWLLQAEFLSSEEAVQELRQYTDTFEVLEAHPFYKASAILLVRKENNQQNIP